MMLGKRKASAMLRAVHPHDDPKQPLIYAPAKEVVNGASVVLRERVAANQLPSAEAKTEEEATVEAEAEAKAAAETAASIPCDIQPISHACGRCGERPAAQPLHARYPPAATSRTARRRGSGCPHVVQR